MLIKLQIKLVKTKIFVLSYSKSSKSEHSSKSAHQVDTKKKPKEVSAPKEKDIPKASKTYDLPSVQSKETLLLDYDHKQQYVKRKLVSNWDRYDEPSNEEEDPQLMAADFEKILSTPQSVGSYFTFASERDWTEDGGNGIINNLFKLDLSMLENGIGRLPFYVRHDMPKDHFLAEEIADMNQRVNYAENREASSRKSAGNEFTQNMLNLLSNSSGKDQTFSKPKESDSVKANESTVPDRVVQSMQKLSVQTEPKSDNVASDSPKKVEPNKSFRAPPMLTASAPSHTPSSKATKDSNEDIQDWLDDILNDS